MTKLENFSLARDACYIRIGVIVSTHSAKSGHPGGSLSAADLFAYLYHKELRIDPQNLKWEEHDHFVLSKLKDFGFNVVSIHGHDFDAMEQAFASFHACDGKPMAILMTTIKGKGVSYMENSVDWHGKAPNDVEFKIAMDELHSLLMELEAAQ